MAADGIADELIANGFVGDVTDGSIGLDMQWSCHDGGNPGIGIREQRLAPLFGADEKKTMAVVHLPTYTEAERQDTPADL